MQLLQDRIIRDGKVFPGKILKVDSFLNHQMDIHLLEEIGKEFHKLYGNTEITKILTIEASGIGIACFVAQCFGVPLIFAKKTKTKNIAADVYTSRVDSYTHGTTYDIIVSKEFLSSEDSVLIIDDFLAKGKALMGLVDIVNQSGANLAGAGIVIEKSFQEGGEILRKKGIRIESLAVIESLGDDGTITFKN